MRILFYGLMVAMMVVLGTSCVPMSSSSSLICETDSGSSANVREIYGTWTLLKGYTDDPRTELELENDFDVLIVQTGGAICRLGYVSKSPIETVMNGVYQHDVNAKKLILTLDVPFSTEVQGTYSFSGSCGDPRMTLRYTNGAVETYRFRGKDVGDGCSFE